MPKLYIISLNEAAKIPREYCAERFPRRLEKSQRFRFENDRLRSIGAGALISGILGIDEAEISENEYGKPVSTRGTNFNISHSGEYVILAANDGEIGADIEKKDASHIKIAKRVYQTDELDWMADDPENRFFTLWTLKESVMKLCGLGFSLPPLSFSVMSIINGSFITLFDRKIYGFSTEINGHAISTCAYEPFAAPPLISVSAADITIRDSFRA